MRRNCSIAIVAFRNPNKAFSKELSKFLKGGIYFLARAAIDQVGLNLNYII
jgi:hypothetical protein